MAGVIGFELVKTDVSVFEGVKYNRMSSVSKINWREREQARKQSAIDEARRRAVEVSEISFPSLGGGSGAGAGAGWGVAELPKPSVASQKWSDIPAVLDDERFAPTTSSSTKPSYAPPVVISRAKIAESIRRSATSSSSARDDRHYEEQEDGNDGDDEGWQEVRKKPVTKSKVASKRDYSADLAFGDDDDFEDEDGFASRNS